jgi:hypothetical protein
MLTMSSFLFAQRGGAGRGGGASAQRGPQSSVGQQGGAAEQQRGLSDQQRRRIRATDPQREQYRATLQSARQLRTRAGEMARRARAAERNLAEYRALYATFQRELLLMQQEHEKLVSGLSEEQRAATRQTDREIEADLEELDLWAEVMDEELKTSDPDPKLVSQKAHRIGNSAEKLEKDYRALDSALDLD